MKNIGLRVSILVISFVWLNLHNFWCDTARNEAHEQPANVVDDLHSAEDGEAGEESHGATNHSQLGL